MFKQCAIYVIMIAFVFMGSTQLYTFIMQHRDPIAYHRVWTDTPEVKLGGVFRAHYDLTRLRPCRTDVSVIMEDEKSRAVVRRENYVGAARLAGRYDDIPLTFQLPPPDKVGCYLLTTTAINYCDEGLHVVPAPIVRFCVVD